MEPQHLSDSERASYEKSIGRLQQATVLEKIILWLVLLIAAAGLIFTVVGLNNSRNEAIATGKRQGELLQQIKKSADSRQKQLNDLQNHIDCIVALFQRPNHDQLVISDIENCDINSLRTSQTNETTKTSLPSKSTTSTMPVQQSSPSPTPKHHANGGSSAAPRHLQLLGIPVCLPFTSICVDR